MSQVCEKCAKCISSGCQVVLGVSSVGQVCPVCVKVV